VNATQCPELNKRAGVQELTTAREGCDGWSAGTYAIRFAVRLDLDADTSAWIKSSCAQFTIER
jgi:hypothetical protein